MRSRPFQLLFIITAFVSLAGSVSVHAKDGEKRWSFLGYTKFRDAYFIDKQNITYPAHDTVMVWAKIAPSKKSKYYKQAIRELKKARKSSRWFKHAEILNEIDCSKKRIRYQKIVYFNKKGKVIHSSSNPKSKWIAIEPGSFWENLWEAVCAK